MLIDADYDELNTYSHDKAKSQVRKQGDRQTPIRDLEGQGASRAGVRAAAPDHQEAGQHAFPSYNFSQKNRCREIR